MTLVRGLTGVIHRTDCSVVGRIHKVVAPDLPYGELDDFLATRNEEVCQMCLRGHSATRSKSKLEGRE